MDANETFETVTVPRTTGNGYFVLVFITSVLIVTIALRKEHVVGTFGATITLAICGVVGLVNLLSRQVCVFTTVPRSMRIERWIMGMRVHSESVDIASTSRIRSHWTMSGLSLELGDDVSWKTINVQTAYLTKGQQTLSRGEQASRMDEVRSSIARVLKIRDDGWEKYST